MHVLFEGLIEGGPCLIKKTTDERKLLVRKFVPMLLKVLFDLVEDGIAADGRAKLEASL